MYIPNLSQNGDIYQLPTEEAVSTVHLPTVKNSQSWSSIKRVNQIGHMRRQMLEHIVMDCCVVCEHGLWSTELGGRSYQ